MIDLAPYVIFEDNHLLVLEKPAGLPVQSDSSGDTTFTDAAAEYIRRKTGKTGNVYIGLPHRLDRPVSGVMVLARTSKAAARLSTQFSGRDVEKIYLAWAAGFPGYSGSCHDRLTRNGKICRVTESVSEGREAHLDYRTLTRMQEASLLGLRLHSGRHHQIRCQLAHRGYPVVGDTLYGSRQTFNPGKIALHSWKLSFYHPVSKDKITFTRWPDRWPGPYGSVFTEREKKSLQEILDLL